MRRSHYGIARVPHLGEYRGPTKDGYSRRRVVNHRICVWRDLRQGSVWEALPRISIAQAIQVVLEQQHEKRVSVKGNRSRV